MPRSATSPFPLYIPRQTKRPRSVRSPSKKRFPVPHTSILAPSSSRHQPLQLCPSFRSSIRGPGPRPRSPTIPPPDVQSEITRQELGRTKARSPKKRPSGLAVSAVGRSLHVSYYVCLSPRMNRPVVLPANCDRFEPHLTKMFLTLISKYTDDFPQAVKQFSKSIPLTFLVSRHGLSVAPDHIWRVWMCKQYPSLLPAARSPSRCGCASDRVPLLSTPWHHVGRGRSSRGHQDFDGLDLQPLPEQRPSIG